jgi:hypothetical protein
MEATAAGARDDPEEPTSGAAEVAGARLRSVGPDWKGLSLAGGLTEAVGVVESSAPLISTPAIDETCVSPGRVWLVLRWSGEIWGCHGTSTTGLYDVAGGGVCGADSGLETTRRLGFVGAGRGREREAIGTLSSSSNARGTVAFGSFDILAFFGAGCCAGRSLSTSDAKETVAFGSFDTLAFFGAGHGAWAVGAPPPTCALASWHG